MGGSFAASDAGGVSRRRFLRDAGVATLVAGDVLAGPASARTRTRRRRRPSVAVFGGGIAGLTAAHELAERGFDVTVYERRAWGGKARSTSVPRSATGGRRKLPGEHGFRVFFGFYQNTVETFRRIPFESNLNGVFDNLVAAPNLVFARDRGRRNLAIPFSAHDPSRGSFDPQAMTPREVLDLVVGMLTELDMPPDQLAFFASRLMVYFSSCDARRLGEWENVTWEDFSRAREYSEDYRRILVKTFSELSQASKASITSASTACHYLEMCMYGMLGGGNANGPLIRTLNRPTNEALIDPWVGVLRGLGVKLRLHQQVTSLIMRGGRIAGARVRTPRGVRVVEADYYVCATPVERTRKLWSRAILKADPSLAGMFRLSTDWMNGIKFFLRRRTPVTSGSFVCVDAPWAIGGAAQAQFWPLDFAATYGDGSVHDCLSVDVANWHVPGVLYGKPATDCSPKQVAAEVWEQTKQHLNKPSSTVLTDDDLHSWDIDPGMLLRKRRLVSGDPLVLPGVGERAHRPDPETAIPNLMLAGDYLSTDWEVSSMEAASYTGRLAANAILDRSGSTHGPAAAFPPYRPPEWEAFKRIDEERYRQGQPNLLYSVTTLPELRALLTT
jgi:uncharacterized protein with NAD-binding domain and iron-sulfur cluster